MKQTVSFEKLKLTNNMLDKNGQVGQQPSALGKYKTTGTIKLHFVFDIIVFRKSGWSYLLY